jgi:cytosine/adenosine deaminase-related metal-dependent hydrolase
VLTHIAESEAVESAVRDAYPDLLDDVDLFAEIGLLTRRTLLGHGVCLSESMSRQVAETKAAVVHCPTANLFLECGLMDYLTERRAQIPLALGSSVAAGPEPFMPQVAVACLQTAKALGVHAIPRRSHTPPRPAEGWWLLTGGAARALDMGDRVGALEPGYEADCLVVRPDAWIAELPPRAADLGAAVHAPPAPHRARLHRGPPRRPVGADRASARWWPRTITPPSRHAGSRTATRPGRRLSHARPDASRPS